MYQKEDASCKKCKNLLFDFVSNYTKESQNHWLMEHLMHCPSCQKEYEEIQQMLSLLHEDAEVELPAGFQLSLHRKLVDAAQEMESKKQKSWIHKLKNMPAIGTVAPALVCLVLVMGVFSSGLFADWKNADSILVEEPKPVVVSTQPPIETPMPTAEIVVDSQPSLTPEQAASKPAKDKALSKQEPAKTEELPVVASLQEESSAVESVKDKTEVAVAAETIDGASGGSRAFSLEEDAVEAVATSYVLQVPQPILSFLKEASRETSTDWTTKANYDGTTATLHLSESEWELLSNYIQSLNLVPTILNQGDTGTEVTVTIQGIEG